MKALLLALGCVVIACGSSNVGGNDAAMDSAGAPGVAGSYEPPPLGLPSGQLPGGASGGQPGATDAEAGGEGGASPVDKLFGPCGRRSCSGLACLQRICTFDCLATGTDVPGKYCVSLGAMCNGDDSGIVSCQPQ